MGTEPATALLARAQAARAAGDLPATRTHLVEAFRAAREESDVEALAEAALGLPSVLGFGTHPGQVPAYLHEALLANRDPILHARLLIGLARAWTYGGEPARAAAFAREAQEAAADLADPALTADALDAALLTSWGPDDFVERIRLAARIEEVSAHLADPEQRMTAHLWRLTTAWECLDTLAVRRQLRALDLLAEETGSPRIAFFARSRHCMQALVVGNLAEVALLRAEVAELGAGLAEADVMAVTQSLRGEHALVAGDHAELASVAELAEGFALTEGIVSLLAQAAFDWWHLGLPDRAAAALDRLPDLAALPDDVDTLLTLSSVAHAAAGLGRLDLAAEAAALLEPYAGRAILNAAAVTFHGVVDDALARVARARGEDAGGWQRSALAAYRRIGATWWAEQLQDGRDDPAAPPPAPVEVRHLHRVGDAWQVGAGAGVVLPDLRGLQHLHHLLGHPGVEVPAVELSDTAAGHTGTSTHEPDLGPVLDETAKRAYRRRLADLDEEIDAAAAWSDQGRLERATEEREAVLHELSAAVGLAGRDRRTGGAAERARVAVRKAVAAALVRIEQHDPATARLLRDCVHTGASCRYEPDPARPVRWVLEVADIP